MKTSSATLVCVCSLILLAGCGTPFDRPKPDGPVDRTEEQEVFSYENESYDWMLQHRITQWINRPMWESNKQLGVVRTEKGWGIMGFDDNWIRRPKYDFILRTISSSENSYPEDIFARLKTDNRVYLIDANGDVIESYEGGLDPYQSIDRVKSLSVYYVQEYGSVFSVKPGSDYEESTDLNSYAIGRFHNLGWTANRAADCDGWVVRMEGQDTQHVSQRWFVNSSSVFEHPSTKIDPIQSTAKKGKQNCFPGRQIKKKSNSQSVQIGEN